MVSAAARAVAVILMLRAHWPTASVLAALHTPHDSMLT